MKEYKWIWAVRILAGAGLGLFFSVAYLRKTSLPSIPCVSIPFLGLPVHRFWTVGHFLRIVGPR